MKILILFLLFLTSCTSPDVSDINPLEKYLSPQAKDDADLREEYMDLVNRHRSRLGLDEFIYSPEIENLAQEHSINMARGQVPFGHDGSGVRCQKLMTEIGPANLCGEIVAKGQDDPVKVFTAWKSSSSHRSKIENSRYTHSAVGVGRNSEGVIFWTQIFLEVL